MSWRWTSRGSVSHASSGRAWVVSRKLAPSAAHLPVDRFVEPHVFAQWRREALAMGFAAAAAGTFVRSSYHAAELFDEISCLRGAAVPAT